MSWSRQPKCAVVLGSRRLLAMQGDSVLANVELRAFDLARLAEVLAALPASARRGLRIWLTPELCEVRLIDLPPVSAEQAVGSLTRNAARHFLNADQTPIVCASRQPGSTRALAAAAPTDLIECIYAAAASAGCTVEWIAPIHEAVLSQPNSRKASSASVLLRFNDTIELCRIGARTTLELRRFPADRLDLIDESIDQQSDLQVFEARYALAAEKDDAFIRAALSRTRPALRFETETVRSRTRARTGRRIVFGWVSVVALACIGGLVERWGTQRELEAVIRQRAQFRTAADSALAVYERSQSRNHRALALMEVALEKSEWSGVLDRLGRGLPPATYVTSMNAERDSVRMEVAAADAVKAIEAFKETVGFADFRVIGSIQQPAKTDSTGIEQFVFAGPASNRAGEK